MSVTTRGGRRKTSRYALTGLRLRSDEALVRVGILNPHGSTAHT
jgi:hypothetical protein